MSTTRLRRHEGMYGSMGEGRQLRVGRMWGWEEKGKVVMAQRQRKQVAGWRTGDTQAFFT